MVGVGLGIRVIGKCYGLGSLILVAKCRFVVKAFAHGAWIVGSILHDGTSEQFLVPAIVPRRV